MKTKIILFVLLSSGLLASCGAPAQTGETEVTAMVGRKVKVNAGSYNKVVCIGAGALRLYSYIGEVSKLAGVEDIDNENLSERPKMFDGVARPYVLANGDIFKTLPSCGVGGPNAQTAEGEKILSCKPDIVFSEYEDKDKADSLSTLLGVPVITLAFGKGGMLDQDLWSKSMKLIGQVMNKEERANALINYYDSSIKEISDKTKDITEKKKAYICGLGNWGTTDQFMTSGAYEPFRIANIENVAKDIASSGVAKIDEEKFASLSKDMDTMIFDAAAVKNIRGKGFDFSSCKAFETGEVYLQMAYNAYYINVETALMNTYFCAKSVYPSLFEDIDMEKKANEITKMFNGKELYNEIKAKPQSFGGYQKIADPAAFFA